MFILERVKNACFNFSTLFGLGKNIFGPLFATFISLPIIFLIKLINKLIPVNYFYYVIISLLFVYLIITVLSLSFIAQEDKSTIVINKIVGMLFVFWTIDLNVKFFITGLILFNIITLLAPCILNHFFGIENFRFKPFYVYIDILFSDIFYGLISNLFLHFLVWLAR